MNHFRKRKWIILRILAILDAKNSKNLQLRDILLNNSVDIPSCKNLYINRVMDQNIKKLLISAVFASCIASILKKRKSYKFQFGTSSMTRAQCFILFFFFKYKNIPSPLNNACSQSEQNIVHDPRNASKTLEEME